jgi:membrane protease YdiL (CAAX protease family)
MVMEALLYALVMFQGSAALATIVHRRLVERLAVGQTQWSSVWLSVGAGVYEELFFRLLLLGGGALVLQRLFEFGRVVSLVLMLLISSLAFSATHHVGSMGEPFDSFVFTFRAVCGLGLGILYVARGLGIAAWTHAIYNIMVLVVYGSGP